MSSVRHIKVSEDDDGQRLERWLKKYVPELPYRLSHKLIRNGQIRVDSKRAKPSTRLAAGQDVRIPPIQDKPKDGVKRDLTEKETALIKSMVIYEDEDVIAINKPYGLATQGGTKTTHHIDAMLSALTNSKGVKPRLVHRLDKETSGVLLLARSADAARKLGAAFSSRDIKKIYFAVTAPVPTPRQGRVNAPIAKGEGGRKERMEINGDREDSKKAVTMYSVLETAGDNAAFVAFWPRTGRTHQIRVHAADVLNTPLLCDTKYGGQGPKDFDGMDVAKRLHLHAARIICPHPFKKGMLDISAPLPEELVKSFKSFGFNTKFKADPFADVQ